MLGTVAETSEEDSENLHTPAYSDSKESDPLPANQQAVFFRDELQRFATRALRHELAELRSQFRQDLEEELRKLQSASPRWNSKGLLHDPFPDARRSDSLRNTGLVDSLGDVAGPGSFLIDLKPEYPVNVPAPESPKTVCKPPGSPPLTTMWAQERPSSRGQDGIPDLSEEHGFEPNGTDQNGMRSCLHKEPTARLKSVTWMTGRSGSMASMNTIRSTKFSASEDAVRFEGNENDNDNESTRSSRTASMKRKRLSTLERASQQKKSKRNRMKSIKRSKSSLPFSSLMNDPDFSRVRKVCIVVGQCLESSISIFIVLNAIFIGVQTDYQARNVTEVVPDVFEGMEYFFCFIFTGELLFKLSFWRLKFFTMTGVWGWNLFDFFLVSIQLVEVVGMMTTPAGEQGEGGNPVGNVSFLRLLRILRLFRVLRLVRLLHFIGELATIISSIINCLRALCWTVLLLFMMIYIVAIVITQVVFTHRVSLKYDEKQDSPELAKYWGSLGLSTLSLYQAILGGVDWETVEEPMRSQISWGPLLSIMFALYIAFTLLAVMNVITGTFVQSALQNAENEKTDDFRIAAWKAFEDHDKITFDAFENKIGDTSFSGWLTSLGIEQTDARLLFQLLDRENLGQVDAEKLVGNMVRLREGAKFMDIMKLMYEHDALTQRIDGWTFMDNFEEELTKMSHRVSENVVSQVMARWAPEAGAGRAAPKQLSVYNIRPLPPRSSPKAGDSAAGVPVADANRSSEHNPLEIEEF